MQQMEEGTKMSVDPDSKTPYSDVTQVSLTIFTAVEMSIIRMITYQCFESNYKFSTLDLEGHHLKWKATHFFSH